MSIKHPTSIQMLKDLKSVGCSSILVDQLLDELKNDPQKLNDVEELFKSHQYPNKSITWIKRFIDFDYQSCLSEYGIKVFDFMQVHMRSGTNLLQISLNDLLLVLNSKSKHTIQNALNELLEKGFIAIKIKGKGRVSSVYMINPQIAIKGNCNVAYLTREFWKLTGTTYKDYYNYKNHNKKIDDVNAIDEFSKPHSNFIDLSTKSKPYSMGYDKQEISNGTLYFNKINPPKIERLPITYTTNENEMDDLPI